MDTISYVALTRQAGLMNKMQVVANNIANMATTGFRAEGVVFAEMIERLPVEGGSIAMTATRARYTDAAQGNLVPTGGTYDIGIEGEGYFQIETAQGTMLTRAGAFSRNQDSELVTMDGHPVLDAGGARIFIPPDAARISIATDGTIDADGTAVGQLGIVTVADPQMLERAAGVMFASDQETIPVENPVLMQGFVEASNVNPVVEITRMIEVQRGYEIGQKLIERDDERIRTVIRTLGGTT